jgi:hypothetical protein
MTLNSRKNNPNDPITFTADDMPVIAKLHAANKTRAALTKSQTGDLIRGQRIDDRDSDLFQAT